MNKKNLFIGAVAFLGLIAATFTVSSVLAAQPVENYGNRGAMMRNLSNDDFKKMSEARNLMAEGKYDEARKIMQDLGMGNCPMLNGAAGNNAGNFGGMMGNFPR